MGRRLCCGRVLICNFRCKNQHLAINKNKLGFNGSGLGVVGSYSSFSSDLIRFVILATITFFGEKDQFAYLLCFKKTYEQRTHSMVLAFFNFCFQLEDKT